MLPARGSPDLLPALVAESARKSRVCWLSWPGVDGRPTAPRLVWHAWYDGALAVLSGDEGQVLPGLAQLLGAGTVEVSVRSKDTGGRLLAWSGSVEVVDPGDESWEQVAGALLGVRLNLRDPAATLAAWRMGATVLRIVPADVTGKTDPGPLP